MCRPNGREQGELHARLVRFASRQDLDEVARFDLDVNLDAIGGDGQTPHRQVVFRMLQWVDQHGRWAEFLGALCHRMRHDRQVVLLCGRLLGRDGAAGPPAITWTIPLTITIRAGRPG